jgi:hypothetical protein
LALAIIHLQGSAGMNRRLGKVSLSPPTLDEKKGVLPAAALSVIVGGR